jgi:carboxyl-terminal processing protease
MNRRFKFAVVSMSSCLVALMLFGAVRGNSASPEDTYRHLAVYTEVLSRIKSDYVEEPDMKNVTLGALNGLLESIDPYASYLNAEQFKDYLKAKDQHKADVGLVLARKFGYVGIIDSIPGSPAANAGLVTGDILESINGVSTRDMPLAYAELLLEGDPGSTVEVGVLRFRNPEPQKISLKREFIKNPPVTGRMMADNVGVITVASLGSGEVKQVASEVRSLEKQGAKRLVLDLRRCAIGGPDKGIELANLFLDKGLIAYSEGQKVARENYEAKPSEAITHLPLAVITDRGTANGAEVAAAALLDDKRAEVVGEHTYGDAAIRKPVTMDDGSAVILSVAKFYSPSGKSIQDNGVTPTVAMLESEPVPDSDDDGSATQPNVTPQPKQKTPSEDPLLKKAIEVVTTGNHEMADKNASPAQAPGKSMTPLNIPENNEPK